ncbi:hypothetical protein [Thermococcus sp. 2319x1]|uniref:hypothetical protein n=1 Tax=Thermococcus sp. 2319x1 TaxID=1674923 RepID=UPI0015813FCE|nr:hypothetical protein [Thermococcus sp. 2319x1]
MMLGLFKPYGKMAKKEAKNLNIHPHSKDVIAMPVVFEVKGKRFLAKFLWNN